MFPEKERVCDNCGRWIEKTEVLYHMQISMMAEPEVHLDIDAIESVEDIKKEIQRLYDKMEQMSPEEAAEAKAQVYEHYIYFLCPECRNEMHHRLKRMRKPPEFSD